jgi:hypothetical protein
MVETSGLQRLPEACGTATWSWLMGHPPARSCGQGQGDLTRSCRAPSLPASRPRARPHTCAETSAWSVGGRR